VAFCYLRNLPEFYKRLNIASAEAICSNELGNLCLIYDVGTKLL